MPDTVIRSSQTPEVVADVPHVDVPLNDTHVGTEPSDLEPAADRSNIVLESLGIDESTNSLPAEDKANLSVVKEYVMDILKSKDLPQTVGSFKTTLNNIKGEMGLDPMAEPSMVLDRIAGVVKAWRNLSFMKDSVERRRIFFMLANMKSSSEMNKKVLDTMENYKIWQ
jgi:hypothetical protein